MFHITDIRHVTLIRSEETEACAFTGMPTSAAETVVVIRHESRIEERLISITTGFSHTIISITPRTNGFRIHHRCFRRSHSLWISRFRSNYNIFTAVSDEKSSRTHRKAVLRRLQARHVCSWTDILNEHWRDAMIERFLNIRFTPHFTGKTKPINRSIDRTNQNTMWRWWKHRSIGILFFLWRCAMTHVFFYSTSIERFLKRTAEQTITSGTSNGKRTNQ